MFPHCLSQFPTCVAQPISLPRFPTWCEFAFGILTVCQDNLHYSHFDGVRSSEKSSLPFWWSILTSKKFTPILIEFPVFNVFFCSCLLEHARAKKVHSHFDGAFSPQKSSRPFWLSFRGLTCFLVPACLSTLERKKFTPILMEHSHGEKVHSHFDGVYENEWLLIVNHSHLVWVSSRENLTLPTWMKKIPTWMSNPVT